MFPHVGGGHSNADEADWTRIGSKIGPKIAQGSAADADIDATISSAKLKLLNRVQSNEFNVRGSLFTTLAQHRA